MKTRHASEDSPFRQERFMSSPELERGLLANCVASRLRVVDCPEEKKLVWWIQKLSHTPGALDALAKAIAERQSARFCTRAMQRLGMEPGQIYSAEEMAEICQGMRALCLPWIERGEQAPAAAEDDDWIGDRFVSRPKKSADTYRPARVEELRAYCLAAALGEVHCYPATGGLAVWLFEEACLNPQVKLSAGLWYLPELKAALLQAHDEMTTAEVAKRPVVTTAGAKLHGALDFCLRRRCLVTITGNSRIGKTFALEQWIARHPGRARYVQCPSTGDDISFYRAIARALGLADSHAYKAAELRERIEETLRGGDLAILFDEAHFLFPMRSSSRAPIPHRLNFILTQLVNQGVPVALVSTPQFANCQAAFVKQGGWSDAQFTGRVLRHTTLPETLTAEDLHAVARFYMPSAEEADLELFVAYAEASDKGMQAIQSLFECAAFLAEEAGHAEPTGADLRLALADSVLPSDKAMAALMSTAAGAARKQAALPRPTAPRPVAPAVAGQGSRKPIAAPLQKPHFQAPARDSSAPVLQLTPGRVSASEPVLQED